MLPGEGQEPRGELAARRAGVYGGEPVPAHGQAAQTIVRPFVMFADIHRELGRVELDNSPGGHVAALGPVPVVATGAHPGFEKRAVPVHPVAAAQKHGVGHARLLVVGKLLARRDKPLWERQVHVRRARTWPCAVGVEMFLRRAFGIVVWYWVGPMNEIRRGATLDSAHALVEVAGVAAV